MFQICSNLGIYNFMHTNEAYLQWHKYQCFVRVLYQNNFTDFEGFIQTCLVRIRIQLYFHALTQKTIAISIAAIALNRATGKRES